MIGGMSVAAKTERDPASCYETPAWLVERIRAAFGGVIGLDPCTTSENPVGALRFYAPPDDGILIPWDWDVPTIYLNPPYGRTIPHWIGKALLANACGAAVIMLVPARTDSAWFQGLVKQSKATVFMSGRVKFEGTESSAPFPSALIGLNHDLAALADLGLRMVRA